MKKIVTSFIHALKVLNFLKFVILLLMFPLKTYSISTSLYITQDTVISSDMSWNYNFVYVKGNVTISENAKLTIAAGTKVTFNNAGCYKIIVNNGCIKALGTKAQPITFAVNDTTNGYWNYATSAKAWDGITINNSTNTTDSIVFRFCNFKYTKAQGVSYRAAIRLNNCKKICFVNCTFDSNIQSIYATNTKLYIDSCSLLKSAKFIRDASYYRNNNRDIYVEESSELIIKNSLINSSCLRFIESVNSTVTSRNNNFVYTQYDYISVISQNTANSYDNSFIFSNNSTINSVKDTFNTVVRIQHGILARYSSKFNIDSASFNNLDKTIRYIFSDGNISNTTVTGSGNGLYLSNGKFNVSKCTFTGCGNGIYMQEFANAVISKCFIKDNNRGLHLDQADVRIENTKIFNSTSQGAIYCLQSKIELYNCLITNNTSAEGSVIYAKQCEINIYNSTIAYNKDNSSTGAPLYLFDTKGYIYNSIIWYNNAGGSNRQVYINSTGEQPSFYNCDITDGKPMFVLGGVTGFTGEYLNNIDITPEFTDISGITGAGNSGGNGNTADWSLKSTSKCINAGTNDSKLLIKDLNNETRIMYGYVDMGCYEKHVASADASCNIISNTMWMADTINVNCNVYVNDDVYLKIAPGTVVKFTGRYHILCRGLFQAIGTKEQPIVFTRNDTAGLYQNNTNGSWAGLYLGSFYKSHVNDGMDSATTAYIENDTTALDYCVFKHAKPYVTLTQYRAVVNFGLNRTKFKCTNSTFSTIYAGGTVIDHAYCIVIYRGSGEIKNNLFNNCNMRTGGVVYVGFYSANITNNKFYNNKGSIILNLNSAKIRLESNEIYNNSGTQLILGAACNFTMMNNLVYNNSCTNILNGTNIPEGFVVNNTFGSNSVTGNFFDVSNVLSANNIFYNNTTCNFNFTSQSSFENSFLQSNASLNTNYTFKNCIYGNPLFVKPTVVKGNNPIPAVVNWNITPLSPCINAGTLNGFSPSTTDFIGKNRQNEIIDIGAYEHQGAKPTFTLQPKGKNLCEGNTILLAVAASDTAVFQWLKDGNEISLATNDTLLIPAATLNDLGLYSCKARNGFGTTSSDAVQVNVGAIPEILSSPESRFVDNGSPVSIEVPVSGTKPLNISWYKDNTLLPLLTKAELKMPAFAPAGEGVYKMIAQNVCGSDTSSAFGLYLSAKIAFTKGLSGFCIGNRNVIKLTKSFPGTITWYLNGALIANENKDSLVIASLSKSNEGAYQCIIVTSYGNISTNQLYLVASEAPIFTAQPASQWVTENNSLTAEVTASGSNPLLYQWLRDETLITGENSSRYVIGGFTKNDEKVYKCMVSNLCGKDTTDNAAFMISPVIKTNTANGEPVACENNTVQLSVTAAFSPSYQWKKDGQNISGATSSTLILNDVNELSKGNYSCAVSNFYGQTETSPVFLQVLSKPTITVEPTSQWVYSGSAFNLRTAVEGSKPIKYMWLNNNVLQKDSLAEIRFTSFASVNEGIYQCIVSNTCGTDTSALAKLSVAPELINPSGTSVCENDTFALEVVFNNNATIQWYKNGALLANQSSKKFTLLKTNAKNIGNYSCRVSNAEGFAILGPVQLSIAIPPSVAPLQKVTYVDGSLSISLNVQAMGDEPLTYQWFKNGTSISGKTTESLELNSLSNADEALYKCSISNLCGSIETNETKLVLAPQICMVTSSFANDSNKNFLIWDRNSKYPYKQYNVYREGSVAGKYQLIGKVPYKSVTAFTDSFVNPKSQAYVYKITALDSSGVETDINATAYHKTIHLLVTQGIPSGIQLDWDEYIGFDYGTYNIFRSTNNAAFAKVHDMASTSRTWTDFDAPETQALKYYVTVDKLKPCLAKDLRKAGAGPLSAAVSNMEDNSRLRSTSVGLYSFDNEASIYPNPFNNNAELNYILDKSAMVEITITDFSGKQVEKLIKANQSSGKYSINVGEKLKAGIYFIRINTNGNYKNYKLVKL